MYKFNNSDLIDLLVCEKHGDGLISRHDFNEVCCRRNCCYEVENRIIKYSSNEDLELLSEVKVRDSQSSGYLAHSKFPIQIYRFEKFINMVPDRLKTYPALDLGCGPGPTTKILLESDYNTVAVDFSKESLLINIINNKNVIDRVIFVQADLNRIRLKKNSAGVLVMADFLQHLGKYNIQKNFLHKAISTLVPGGLFFLSFFNTNIKNYLKGDIKGRFSNGRIPYRRLSVKEVISMLPDGVIIREIKPMNVFPGVFPDRIFSAVPIISEMLARMIVIIGEKDGSDIRK